MKKRLFALFLSALMAVSLLSLSATAAETSKPDGGDMFLPPLADLDFPGAPNANEWRVVKAAEFTPADSDESKENGPNTALSPQSKEEAAALGLPTQSWPDPIPDPSENPFTDVKANSPFLAPILWAVSEGITNGTTATTFSPSAPCTHTQILTFLWRACGSPEPTVSNPFTDVQPETYYYKAALWAAEKGLVSGSVFNGYAPCTRLDAITYLWKLAGAPSTYETREREILAGEILFPFTDVSASDMDALNAVAWSVIDVSVTNGTSGSAFSPDNTCTRGQIVTFLYRARPMFAGMASA